MGMLTELFDTMVADNIRGLDAASAASRRSELMDNSVLHELYAEDELLRVTLDRDVVESLPCERVAFTFPQQDPQDRGHWQHDGRGQLNIGRTRDGDLWAFMKQGVIFHSADQGRSWTWAPGSSTMDSEDYTFAVLQDDSFLAIGTVDEDRLHVAHRSDDRGRSWEKIATFPLPAPYTNGGDDTSGTVQLADGTILFTTQCVAGERGRGSLLFRSEDGGRNWSGSEVTWQANQVTDTDPPFPERGVEMTNERPLHAEAHILELADGKLLQTIRWHVQVDGTPWERVHKTVCFLDSEDGGRSWGNARPALDADGEPVLVYGQCHGQTVQLPDGRIVLVHDHRYPYSQGQTMAHVSGDGGQTWDRRTYHVSFGHGYPAVLALPDGTIVTATGRHLLDNAAKTLLPRDLWNSVVVRWRLAE